MWYLLMDIQLYSLEQVKEELGSNSRTIFFPILMDRACSILSKGNLKGPESYRELGGGGEHKMGLGSNFWVA